MKATKRIKKLLKDLQMESDLHALAGGREAQQGQEFLTHSPDEDENVNSSEETISEVGELATRTLMDYSTSSTTDSSTKLSSNVSRIFQDEVECLVQQLGDSRILVATLVAEINILHQEKARKDSQQSHAITRLEEELIHLQRQAHKDMVQLKTRQEEIELDLPVLKEQLNSLKDVLHDLNISKNLYGELLAIPKEKRSVKAHLQILAYEKMQNLKEEVDSLQKERDMSREALTRENTEVEKLKREMHRVLAEVALNKMESEQEMGGVLARNERLEAELRETCVHLEVLKAKGSMYDKVKEKLDKAGEIVMEAESQKAVLVATLQVVTDEKQRLLSTIKDKDHCIDLLNMDKIYLTREVKTNLDHAKKLEQDLERQQVKTKALRSTKKELFEKVLNDGKDTRAAHEQRLEAELSRLREQTNKDIEHIRIEATAVANEKVRTFCEMRDAALSEAERVQAISRENKSMHDEILSKYQELKRVLEAREIKAQSEMKMRDLEIEQLRIVQLEMKCLSNQKSIDNDSLQEKVKLLTERYNTLEMESRQNLAKLRSELDIQQAQFKNLKKKHQRLEEMSGKPFEDLSHELEVAKAHIKIYKQQLSIYEKQALVASGHGTILGAGTDYGIQSGEGTLMSKKKSATHHNDGKNGKKNSNAKNTHVQTFGGEQIIPCKEREEDESKGKVLKELVEASIRHSKYIEKPQNSLKDIIKGAEENHEEIVLPKTKLKSELRKTKIENEHVCNRLQNLQRDLKRILQARGTMENFQKLLREKGICISDEVIKRITGHKLESVTPL